MGAKGGLSNLLFHTVVYVMFCGGCGNGGWKRKCGSERLKGTILGANVGRGKFWKVHQRVRKDLGWKVCFPF